MSSARLWSCSRPPGTTFALGVEEPALQIASCQVPLDVQGLLRRVWFKRTSCDKLLDHFGVHSVDLFSLQSPTIFESSRSSSRGGRCEPVYFPWEMHFF